MTATPPPAPIPRSLTYGEALQTAAALQQAGRLEEAERWYQAVLAVQPDYFQALHMVGIVSAQRGRLAEARERLQRALEVNPHSAEAHSDLGNVLKLQGQWAAALSSFEEALRLRPEFAEALGNRAVVLQAVGRVAEALADCERALALKPGLPDALNTRGVCLIAQSRFAEALASCDEALRARPQYPEALHNRATALSGLTRHEEAVLSCDRALTLAPGYADAWCTRGIALYELRRHDEALASFDRALAVRPDFPRGLQNRMAALFYLGRHEEAIKDLERALALDPALGFARALLLHSKMHCADWRGHDEASARIVADVMAGKLAAEPMTFIALSDSPAAQLQCARTWVREKCPPSASPLWQGERYAHERIRVAYLSADFHEHATAFLMAQLFERHDRARFEVTGVSWGPASASALRTRLQAGFEHFVEVRGQSDREVAQWLRAQEIDIAVDLKGYTYDARPGILAQRAAPVQVNYLGYPGTMGSPYHDYIVADSVVIPEEAQRYYSEQVVTLPDSYQVNDRQREIAAATPTRAQLKLPERGFVFCSFNSTYKITPTVFDVWMRWLRQVEGSVLWLLEGNAAAPANLRREAQARGVDPARLVFAPRLPAAEHLARQRVADLFVDTLPCNAHTTASDALWAGLPVLTCVGQTFAGRVAASLLTAVGLPELITASLDDYEALALRLARDPEQLGALKEKLAANRDTCALFDSARFTRHLEAAYVTMWERVQRAEPAAEITIAAHG